MRLDSEDDHGVLLLKLHSNGWGWSFVRTNGTALDQTAAPQACHSKG